MATNREMKRLEYIASNLIKLNTQSVLLVMEGWQEESITILRNSLHLAKELYDGKFFTSTSPTLDNSNRTFALMPVSLEEALSVLDSSEKFSPNNCFRLFRNVFVVDGDEEQCISYDSFMVLVVTLHYNLAILHQEIGLGIGDLEFLKISYRLYQMTLDLISKHRHIALLYTLELAVSNNLGYMYDFFSNRDGVLEMRSTLFRCLQCSVLDDELYNFFFSSLLNSRDCNPTPVLAPAA